jgi:hypothetical protein
MDMRATAQGRVIMRTTDSCRFLGTAKTAFVLVRAGWRQYCPRSDRERAMTIEDDRDTRTSNWTVATNTRPGRRDVQAPAVVATVRRSEQETTS